MKTLLYSALIGSLSVIAVCLLDYILIVYAEQEPIQCDAGDWIDELERKLVS